MSAPTTKTVEARFTRDPVRLQILQRNYDEGVQRESIPLKERIVLDREVLQMTPEKLADLRLITGLRERE